MNERLKRDYLGHSFMKLEDKYKVIEDNASYTVVLATGFSHVYFLRNEQFKMNNKKRKYRSRSAKTLQHICYNIGIIILPYL